MKLHKKFSQAHSIIKVYLSSFFLTAALTLTALLQFTGCSSSSPSSSSATGTCSTTPAPTYTATAQSVFNTRCTSCHSQYSTYSSVAADSSKIGIKMSSNSMPPSTGLNATEQAILIQWVACGANQ